MYMKHIFSNIYPGTDNIGTGPSSDSKNLVWVHKFLGGLVVWRLTQANKKKKDHCDGRVKTSVNLNLQRQFPTQGACELSIFRQHMMMWVW